MKNITALLLAMLLIFSLAACSKKDGTTSDQLSEEPTKEVTEDITDAPIDYSKVKLYKMNTDYDKVYPIGRTAIVENGITCDFSASGIAFSGTMRDTVRITVETNQEAYFTVYVDGKRLLDRYQVTPEKKLISFDLGEAVGEHTVRIVKQSEIRYTRCVIQNIQIYGVLQAAPIQQDRYIEFIGDSITCGYGVLGDNSVSDPGNVLYADATQAYAFLAAEKLNADYSLVCCGGIGLAIEENKQIVPFNMTDIYSYISAPAYRPDTKKYEATRTPDCVVINLGTNDNAKGVTEEAYKAGVKALIEMVRDNYGNVKIVWAHNAMGESRADWTLAAFDEWCMANAVARDMFLMVKLTQNNAGAGAHPNTEGQIQAAEELSSFLLENIYN